LWESVAADFAAAAENPAALGDETSSTVSFIPKLIRLPHCHIPEIFKKDDENQLDVGINSKENNAVLALNLEASVGILAHRYMELIARDGLPAWPSSRIESLEDIMERWLKQQGHSEQESRQGVASVTKVLIATINSEQGRWVLQTRDSASSELAVATAANDNIATHVIDRTFIEDGERWIIDYKSTQLDESLADAALSQQAENYRSQLERYAAVFMEEGLPIRKAVFFLALGKLIELA
jgi:ATP-dependent exoDNAse (exonuclease V) beta subunit